MTHQLRAVVCHSGIENYGHYYCYGNEGGWKEFNDETVCKVSLNEVTEGREALFLVYERIEKERGAINMVAAVNTLEEAPDQRKRALPQRETQKEGRSFIASTN